MSFQIHKKCATEQETRIFLRLQQLLQDVLSLIGSRFLSVLQNVIPSIKMLRLLKTQQHHYTGASRTNSQIFMVRFFFLTVETIKVIVQCLVSMLLLII